MAPVTINNADATSTFQAPSGCKPPMIAGATKGQCVCQTTTEQQGCVGTIVYRSPATLNRRVKACIYSSSPMPSKVALVRSDPSAPIPSTEKIQSAALEADFTKCMARVVVEELNVETDGSPVASAQAVYFYGVEQFDSKKRSAPEHQAIYRPVACTPMPRFVIRLRELALLAIRKRLWLME